jgi:Ca2+-binding EF-hand superfamily protein
LFSLIKHFKYYDNGTKFINKYDFAKVIRDFRLNLTTTEIEKIYELFTAGNNNTNNSKTNLLNYEQFILVISEKFMNEKRRNLCRRIFDALRETSGGAVDMESIKAYYNGKGNPLIKDEEVNLAEFVECLDNFHFGYKNRRDFKISYEEFEEFYRIMGILLGDDEKFSNVLKNEWKKLGGFEEQTRSRSESVKEKVEYINEVKNTQNSNSRRQSNFKNENNISNNSQIQNLTQDLKPNQNSLNTNNSIQNGPNRNNRPETAKTNTRPITPISTQSKNIPTNPNDRELALAHNNYTITSKSKIQTSDKKLQDSVDKLKHKLRKRGIRGLMNLHKQFLLNCTNLNTISYGDFVRVMRLQRLDFNKEDYDCIFEKFKSDPNSESNSGNYLNFSGFIRNFKRVLPEKRLQFVELAFASLDEQRSEMLSIDEIKLKFNASKHPDVFRRTRSEDEVVTEFLDCFELNYNFLVI